MTFGMRKLPGNSILCLQNNFLFNEAKKRSVETNTNVNALQRVYTYTVLFELCCSSLTKYTSR